MLLLLLKIRIFLGYLNNKILGKILYQNYIIQVISAVYLVTTTVETLILREGPRTWLLFLLPYEFYIRLCTLKIQF